MLLSETNFIDSHLSNSFTLNPLQLPDFIQSSDLSRINQTIPQTIAFVDPGVDDIGEIAAGLKADVTIILDPNQNGIVQISDILGSYKGLTGIEIISHGNIADAQFGISSLDINSITQYSQKLHQWGDSLAPGADILLYGCNVAAGDTGKAFVNELSYLTGADIAASTNPTGNFAKGGDWTLEYVTGKIETPTPFTDVFMNSYQGILLSESVFTPTTTPVRPDATDGSGVTYELGMNFTSTQTGQIQAIRYYKSPSETGAHTGKIWSSTGQLLTSVNFSNETASGWQQQTLSAPLTIAAGTTYTVSVNTNGYYAQTLNQFSTAFTSGGLTAPVGAGVFSTTIGDYPTQVYQNSDYSRDIVFVPTVSNPINHTGTIDIIGTPTQNHTLTASVTDSDGLTGVNITYKWQQSSDHGTTWSDIAGATHQTMTLDSSYVGKKVRVNALYTDTLGGIENIISSESNPVLPLSESVFTSTTTPSRPDATNGPGVTYELGMNFTSTQTGQIQAIRYYKSPSETGAHTGKIWSSTGQLLASVNFSNETASGWQQQTLSTPLTIAAGTTYTVSVNTNGYYAQTLNQFSTAFTSGGLTAPVSAGVFSTTIGDYPTQVYQNSDYSRDIVFVPTLLESVFSSTTTPVRPDATDGPGVTYELGMNFTSTQTGQIQSIRYYKSPSETGAHTGKIWSSTGQLLASVNFSNETASGWQQQTLSTPLTIAAGTTYTVSVNTNGYYAQTLNQFSTALTSGGLTAPVSAGVFSTTIGDYPTQVYQNSDYSRDIVFVPTASNPVNHTGTIDIIGTPTQNHTLTASVTDSDGLTGVSIKYQWQQLSNSTWTNITGAKSQSFTLTQAQVNQEVRVIGTYTDNLGITETSISSTTSSVLNVNDLGNVILKGSPTVGSAVDNTVLDPDGLTGVSIHYQWQELVANIWTNIAGATSKSLTLTTALLGLQVRVLSSYIDALGSSENAFSSEVTVAAHNAIVLENQKLGTTRWQIPDAKLAHNNEIAGYADATSINKGQALNLKVSLAIPGNYRIDVYRLGHYGGAGGRLISSATRLKGVTQAGKTIDPTTRLVEYHWNNSYTLQTDTSWTTGLYEIKLTEARTGKQTYVPFVLRDDNRPADVGFQDAVTTAQAYNFYGGNSLYDYNSTNEQRAYKVSFDRPFDTSIPNHRMLTWEHNMSRWLESQGYDVSYYSNLDVQTNPLQLYSEKTFLDAGHDEYWSMEMRNSIEQARDNGINLAFFSSNTAYWRVRFEPSSTGQANRVMAVYKEDWNLDPIAQQDSSQATNQFRSPQLNRPENALLGVMYTGHSGDFYDGFDHVVSNAADPYYANTNLNNGDILTGLVGYEWDAVVNNGFTPEGLVILSQSHVSPSTIAPYLPLGTNTTIANAVRYTARSGAKVFSTGSMHWVWGLDSSGVPNPRVDLRVQQIAVNVLKDMGIKPQTPGSGIVVA